MSMQVWEALRNVKHGYRDAEEIYCALPFRARRDLSLMFAPERFLCAAILQHRPTEHDFSFPDDLVAEVNNDTTGNELCPVWFEWFSEVREAEAEISRYTNEPSAARLTMVEAILSTAAAKLQDVLTACKAIRSIQGIGEGREDMLKGWNDMCQAVRHGSPVAFGITFLQSFQATNKDPVPQYTRVDFWRRWFKFELFIQHIPGTWYSEINRQMYPSSHTPVEIPKAEEINGFQGSTRTDWSDTKSESQQERPKYGSAPPQYEPKNFKMPSQSPQHATDYQSLMADYNAAWDRLQPHGDNILLPSADFSMPALESPHYIQHSRVLSQAWPKEIVMRANAFTFFTRGFGMDMTVTESQRQITLSIRNVEKAKIQALQRHIKRKECLRWHPDKINIRTGEPGVVDESIGKEDFVVAIRGAVQGLAEECERILAML